MAAVRHPTDLGLEWQALELASRDPQTPDTLAEINDLLTRHDLDLGELLEQSLRHRLMCRLAALVSAPSWEQHLPPTVHFHLMETLRLNRHRVTVLRNAARDVAEALTAAGVRFCLTKGMVLESTVYRSEGTRRMGDIDVMICAEDRTRTSATLTALGFQPGQYSWTTRRVEPLDRRAEITYQLYPDHLPHFLRALDDPVVPYVAVDVANSLTWHGSEWDVPVSMALEDIAWVEVNGDTAIRLPRPSWSMSFLFTVLHFFRDAWFAVNIGDTLDVTLAKVADVYLTWKYYRDEILVQGFVDLIAAHDLGRPVAWVFAHVDRTLGSAMLDGAGLTELADEAWLSSLSGPGGRSLSCTASMRERLWSKRREQLVCP